MTKRAGPRYAIIPADAVTDPSLQGPDLKVLALLGRHIDRKGWCVRSQGRMAKDLNLSRPTVQRSLGRLVDASYVEVSHEKRRDGGQAANSYRVVLDAQARADQLDLFSTFETDAVRVEGDAPPASPVRHPLPHSGEAPPASPGRCTHKERPLYRTSPSDSGAEPRAVGGKPANDHLPKPVPTRTGSSTGAVPPQVAPSAVQFDPQATDAVPFLPILPEPASRSDLDALEDRLRQAAGRSVSEISPSLRDLSAVLRWLTAGCDLDHDVLPAIAGRAARHQGAPVRSWGYFEQIVLEARERRLAIAGRAAVRGTSTIPFDPKGASHGASSRFDPEPAGGRFAAAAARRRRGLAGGSSGGEDR